MVAILLADPTQVRHGFANYDVWKELKPQIRKVVKATGDILVTAQHLSYRVQTFCGK